MNKFSLIFVLISVTLTASFLAAKINLPPPRSLAPRYLPPTSRNTPAPRGLGYDESRYPIKTYTNEKFGFSFEYQKYDVYEAQRSQKELLNLNVGFMCQGEGCGIAVTVRVLDFVSLQQTLSYQIQNDPTIKNVEYLSETITHDGHPALHITYKMEPIFFEEFLISYNNRVISISGGGGRAKDLLANLKLF